MSLSVLAVSNVVTSGHCGFLYLAGARRGICPLAPTATQDAEKERVHGEEDAIPPSTPGVREWGGAHRNRGRAAGEALQAAPRSQVRRRTQQGEGCRKGTAEEEAASRGPVIGVGGRTAARTTGRGLRTRGGLQVQWRISANLSALILV